MFWWGLPVFSKGRCYSLIHLPGQVNFSDGFVYHMHTEAQSWYFVVLVGEPKTPVKIGWLFFVVVVVVVIQSCPTFQPMDCSSPGFPVLHYPPVCSDSCPLIWGCHPTISSSFPLTSVFPSVRVFSNKSALRIRWPKYWSFSFSISPFNEYSGLISFRID